MSKRHLFIAGGSWLLCLSVAALNVLDLKGLISQEVLVDTKLKFHPIADKVPTLPAGYTFAAPVGTVRDDLLPVQTNVGGRTMMGYVDRSGQIVIEPKFDWCGAFVHGLAEAHAVQGREERVLSGVINCKGEWVVPPKYSRISLDRSGTIFTHKTMSTNSTYEQICILNPKTLVETPVSGAQDLLNKDASNLTALDDVTAVDVPARRFQFVTAYPIEAGSSQQLHGLVDGTGTTLVKPQYEAIAPVNEKFSEPINSYNDFHSYDVHVTACEEESPVFIAVKDGKRGLIGLHGEILLPFEFSRIHAYQNGCAAASLPDDARQLVGMVDKTGKFLIAPKYRYLSAYDDLIVARTDEDGGWVFLDKKGKRTAVDKFDDPIIGAKNSWFAEGLARVVVDHKIGFINKSGKFVIKPKYSYASPFQNGLASVWDGSCIKLIDRNGAEIPNCTLGSTTSFCHGFALATRPGPLYGLVNAKGISDFNDVISRQMDTWHGTLLY